MEWGKKRGGKRQNEEEREEVWKVRNGWESKESGRRKRRGGKDVRRWRRGRGS